VVKILSSAFVHLAFIVFIFVLLVVSGVPFSIYNVQVLYYFFCTCVLLLGLCWLLSAIAPFLKDMVNIIGVVIQIGFWMTPIFWSPDKMAPWVQNVLKLNPMFYICRGYRDCFVDHIWFWQYGYTNLFFWGISLVLLLAGAYFFRRLRPQFADVL
jgi:ABC-type polysaccharide/polyol phosphate export permease